MQIKTTIISILALAVGNTLANPVAAEDHTLDSRSVASPDEAELANIRTQALAFASAHINDIPSSFHLSQAKQFFPFWTPHRYKYWPMDYWLYYYCYSYFPQYNYFWDNGYPDCLLGLLCL